MSLAHVQMEACKCMCLSARTLNGESNHLWNYVCVYIYMRICFYMCAYIYACMYTCRYVAWVYGLEFKWQQQAEYT